MVTKTPGVGAKNFLPNQNPFWELGSQVPALFPPMVAGEGSQVFGWVRGHFHVFTYLHISEYSEHKSVQNTFVCAIPIFSSTLGKLRIFPKYKRFFSKECGLGRCKLRLPRSLNLLGAVTCGAQEVSEKKSFKIGKIRSFCKVLEKIGIAQTNVFCTALLGSFDSVMYVRLAVHPSGRSSVWQNA